MARGGGSGGSGGQAGRRFSGGYKPWGGLISSAGDHSVITPAAGRRLEVVWIYFVPSSDNEAANLVTVHFEDSADNMYCGYASAHWEPFPGQPDKSVIVNTATAEDVAVTIHYREMP